MAGGPDFDEIGYRCDLAETRRRAQERDDELYLQRCRKWVPLVMYLVTGALIAWAVL